MENPVLIGTEANGVRRRNGATFAVLAANSKDIEPRHPDAGTRETMNRSNADPDASSRSGIRFGAGTLARSSYSARDVANGE